MDSANLRTPLYDAHVAAGARMVPFGGWDMPVQYPAGIIAEVRAVRTAAGVFDVSHMGRLYLSGPDAGALLDLALTGWASTLDVGRARYCLICNQRGGVIDDTIFYRLDDDLYLLVPNAGNRPAVKEWLQGLIDRRFSGFCTMTDATARTALIALQGPSAAAIADGLCDEPVSGLRSFAFAETRIGGASAMVGRTGYTGEDGFEILVDAGAAGSLWDSLAAAGAAPCGLGARDVLRLEAALPLHGHEIDENTTPIEAGLSRFVAFDKEHIGAEALRRQHESGAERRLAGIRLAGRSAPRAGYRLSRNGGDVGEVTSGSYSPTLDTSIGMAYVQSDCAEPGTRLELDVRGRAAEVEVAPLPFYSRPRPSNPGRRNRRSGSS